MQRNLQKLFKHMFKLVRLSPNQFDKISFLIVSEICSMTKANMRFKNSFAYKNRMQNHPCEMLSWEKVQIEILRNQNISISTKNVFKIHYSFFYDILLNKCNSSVSIIFNRNYFHKKTLKGTFQRKEMIAIFQYLLLFFSPFNFCNFLVTCKHLLQGILWMSTKRHFMNINQA